VIHSYVIYTKEIDNRYGSVENANATVLSKLSPLEGELYVMSILHSEFSFQSSFVCQKIDFLPYGFGEIQGFLFPLHN
jgi:hypothetical protein